jgi:hypothetical protein
MGSTMLQLVQQVTNELGVPTPTYVTGNTSQDVIQINALMNAVGYELLRKADWQQLVKQNIFTTVYTQSNGYTTPTSLTNNTIYGLDSSVAALDSKYQVVGTGVGNATYVSSVVSAGGGLYNVVVSQPLTSATSSEPVTPTPALTSQFYYNFYGAEYLCQYGTGGLSGIAVGQYVIGDYIAEGTTVLSYGYDELNEFWYVQLSQPVTDITVSGPYSVSFYNSLPVAATYGTFYFQKVKYPMPSDYDATIPRTHWDKSKRWEMLGPEDAQQWEWLLSGYISTGPRIRWRIFQGMFQIWPGTSTNELLGFEYRSKAWAESADGDAKNSFTADTDTCIYPDRLVVLGTKLKYFEAKGFDTTAMYRDYLSELETCIAQNTSAANLSFAPRPGTVLIGYDNIPDSGYGN